jgi:hypothetical protein
MPSRVVPQAGKHLGVHPGDTGGGFEQPIAIRIFANGNEDFADRLFDPLEVDVIGLGGVLVDEGRRKGAGRLFGPARVGLNRPGSIGCWGRIGA